MKITKTTTKNGHIYQITLYKIIGGSVSGKTNALINLINEPDNHDFIDKMCLF